MGAVGEQPVREEERVAVAVLRIVSVPNAARKHRINRVARVMSRNVQNAGALCEESELISARNVEIGWGIFGR